MINKGFKIIWGDLIDLTINGLNDRMLNDEAGFDVIAHGCNCFCTQKAGIAFQMARFFKTDTFNLEDIKFKGDINKLGNIDYQLTDDGITVVNAYTQFKPGKDGSYAALRLCMRKINAKLFVHGKIGLPLIGCGIAGLKWEVVEKIMRQELIDCDVTIVRYKPN